MIAWAEQISAKLNAIGVMVALAGGVAAVAGFILSTLWHGYIVLKRRDE